MVEGMKRVWLKIGVVLLVVAGVLVATGCDGPPLGAITHQKIVEEVIPSQAYAQAESSASDASEVEGSFEPALTPTVTVEVSLPKPFWGVVMPASMGHGWHRTPPEKSWELEWVAFSVKSFIPEPVRLDKAIVEIAGKIEEVPLDVELHYKEYKEYTLRLQSIRGMPSGEYELKVSLWSGEQLLCLRSDTARVYWKDP